MTDHTIPAPNGDFKAQGTAPNGSSTEHRPPGRPFSPAAFRQAIAKNEALAELTTIPHWVLWYWKWSKEKEKWDKVPLPVKAKETWANPECRGTCEEALAAFRKEKHGGIGFALPDCPFHASAMTAWWGCGLV
jgi:hypothetical protein